MKRGFVLLLGLCVGFGLPQLAQAQSSWTVSLTPKHAGHLNDLKAKPADTAFALSPDGRKAQIIAGDARRGAVR